MPDRNGNFRGIAVPAHAWERVFARAWKTRPLTVDNCDYDGPFHDYHCTRCSSNDKSAPTR